MERSKGTRTVHSRPVMALAAAVALLFSFAPTVARAGEIQPVGYHAIRLGADGQAETDTVQRLAEAVRPEVGTDGQIVVLVHGYATPLAKGTADYNTVTRRLQDEARALGLRTAVVGVHWASDAGSLQEWMPKAIGNRITSLLGFKKAIRNPYLEKVELARRTGRSGLRAVLFGLQDAF
ncbi:MAG TPA: hypothetical protein VFU47_08330, partial [Armatimonadota bacterium]|nr:hypothetical protein [Armatimonadota bacterium]